MNILSWNIQATKGCDGVYNSQRIIDEIKQCEQLDVICLQELSRFFPDMGNIDQLSVLQEAFPDYEAVWSAAISWRQDSRHRKEFGNLTLVKQPLLEDYHLHTLPWPPAQGLWQMPRTAIETLIRVDRGFLRIINTHLAYHNPVERQLQLGYLSALNQRAIARSLSTNAIDTFGCYAPAPSTNTTILCGDLNLASDSGEYRDFISTADWVDCWQHLNCLNDARTPTCGCFDHQQWPQGPHCRDYFFITCGFEHCLKSMHINTQTDASDHQPIMLRIDI